MENLLLQLSDAFSRAPNRIIRYRLFVLTGLAVLTAVMVWGIFTRTELDMTTDSFLDQEDPAMFALNEFRSQFGSDDSVFLVYRAKDGDIFSRQSLQAVQQLTNDLRNWQALERDDYPESVRGVPLDFNELNHIRRVQSVANMVYRKTSVIACCPIAWFPRYCRTVMPGWKPSKPALWQRKTFCWRFTPRTRATGRSISRLILAPSR